VLNRAGLVVPCWFRAELDSAKSPVFSESNRKPRRALPWHGRGLAFESPRAHHASLGVL